MLLGVRLRTTGLAEQARRGKALVKELDAIMTHLLRDLPSIFATWKSASRIRRNRSTPEAAEATSNPASTGPNGGTSTNN